MDSLRKGDVIVITRDSFNQFGYVDACNFNLGPNNYISVRWLKGKEWAQECEFLHKETKWRLATKAEVGMLPAFDGARRKRAQNSSDAGSGPVIRSARIETSLVLAEELNLIESKKELLENIGTVVNGLTSSDADTRDFFEKLILKGTCFVVALSSGKVIFAPSRFIGYKKKYDDAPPVESRKGRSR